MYMHALRGYEQAWGVEHTSFIVLIPACADICKTYASPLTGQPVALVAAGGVNDGRSLTAALMLGAGAVWIGTRFVIAKESGASECKEVHHRLWLRLGDQKRHLVAIRCGRYRTLTSKIGRRTGRLRSRISQTEASCHLQHELDKLHQEGKLTEQIEDDTMLRYVNTAFRREVQYDAEHADLWESLRE